MYQPLIKFHPHPAIITQVLTIFIEYTFARCEKYSSKLDISRSLIRIFIEYTFARCEKYSSKLHIISLAYSYIYRIYFRSL